MLLENVFVTHPGWNKTKGLQNCWKWELEIVRNIEMWKLMRQGRSNRGWSRGGPTLGHLFQVNITWGHCNVSETRPLFLWVCWSVWGGCDLSMERLRSSFLLSSVCGVGSKSWYTIVWVLQWERRAVELGVKSVGLDKVIKLWYDSIKNGAVW